MTEFKEGDRVKVEFEAIVEFQDDDGTWKMIPHPEVSAHEVVYISEEHMTKIAPTLPTKVGSVIDSHNYRFMLTRGGWRADGDTSWLWSVEDFRNTMYAEDFTVVLEGK